MQSATSQERSRGSKVLHHDAAMLQLDRGAARHCTVQEHAVLKAHRVGYEELAFGKGPSKCYY